MTLLPKEWGTKVLAHLLLGGGVGVAGTVLFVLAEKEPARIVEMFRGWGPGSLIGIIAVLLVSRAFDRMADANEKSAMAAHDLAAAVSRFADKDDREREEQRRLLSFLGTQQEKVLERFDSLGEMLSQLGEKAKGA